SRRSWTTRSRRPPCSSTCSRSSTLPPDGPGRAAEPCPDRAPRRGTWKGWRIMPCLPEETHSGPLLIKFSSSDAGAREIAGCGTTNPYWLSPSLFLGGGAVNPTTADVGAANEVHVRVDNISTQAVQDVNVQVWVCDYTMGVSPASGRPSAGGSNPMTGFI